MSRLKLHASTDGDSSWEPAGQVPGQPQALLAADDGKLWAAAHDEAGAGSAVCPTTGHSCYVMS